MEIGNWDGIWGLRSLACFRNSSTWRLSSSSEKSNWATTLLVCSARPIVRTRDVGGESAKGGCRGQMRSSRTVSCEVNEDSGLRSAGGRWRRERSWHTHGAWTRAQAEYILASAATRRS